jgi:hypothetical protein
MALISQRRCERACQLHIHARAHCNYMELCICRKDELCSFKLERKTQIIIPMAYIFRQQLLAATLGNLWPIICLLLINYFCFRIIIFKLKVCPSTCLPPPQLMGMNEILIIHEFSIFKMKSLLLLLLLLLVYGQGLGQKMDQIVTREILKIVDFCLLRS